MFNIYPVHSCHVMSCSAAPCAISTLDLYDIEKCPLCGKSLEQFMASLICDLVVEHVPMAEHCITPYPSTCSKTCPCLVTL